MGNIHPNNTSRPTHENCIYNTDDEDIWDNIDTDKLRESYINECKNNRNMLENPNYIYIVLSVRKYDEIIPLKNKYGGKYLIMRAGEKWDTKELILYLQHLLPWKFVISPLPHIAFGGGGQLGGWCASRVMEPIELKNN